MGNCLVTKLKESVNNSDLRVLNYMKVIKANDSDAFLALKVGTNSVIDIKCIISGDYTVNYNNIDYQNQTITIRVPQGGTALTIIGTANSGSINIEIDTTNALIHKLQLYSINKVIISPELPYLMGINPNIVTNIPQGLILEGNPKTSEWYNFVVANNLQTSITKLVCYKGNILYDLTTAQIGTLTALNTLTTVSNVAPAGVEVDFDGIGIAQVAAGRTSGILTISATSNKRIKFGSSMENPTQKETAQGYQITNL